MDRIPQQLGKRPDHCTQPGAQDLADAINDYWRGLGVNAGARVVRSLDESGCAVFGVRSAVRVTATEDQAAGT